VLELWLGMVVVGVGVGVVGGGCEVENSGYFVGCLVLGLRRLGFLIIRFRV
jgi:hypothetical protein